MSSSSAHRRSPTRSGTSRTRTAGVVVRRRGATVRRDVVTADRSPNISVGADVLWKRPLRVWFEPADTVPSAPPGGALSGGTRPSRTSRRRQLRPGAPGMPAAAAPSPAFVLRARGTSRPRPAAGAGDQLRAAGQPAGRRSRRAARAAIGGAADGAEASRTERGTMDGPPLPCPGAGHRRRYLGSNRLLVRVEPDADGARVPRRMGHRRGERPPGGVAGDREARLRTDEGALRRAKTRLAPRPDCSRSAPPPSASWACSMRSGRRASSTASNVS